MKRRFFDLCLAEPVVVRIGKSLSQNLVLDRVSGSGPDGHADDVLPNRVETCDLER